MKSLLNVTIFVSAVLSIFSTSLTLYEVPELKESLSVSEKEKLDQDFKSEQNIRTVYISRDESDSSKRNQKPLMSSKTSLKEKASEEKSINIFGVEVSNHSKNRNI